MADVSMAYASPAIVHIMPCQLLLLLSVTHSCAVNIKERLLESIGFVVFHAAFAAAVACCRAARDY
jgi:hypothetical protein